MKNVNFSVQQGEFVGASGSGKSTLIHLSGGVDSPSSGQVIINGMDIYATSEEDLAVFRRRKIGFIFQSYNLIPVLSIQLNEAACTMKCTNLTTYDSFFYI